MAFERPGEMIPDVSIILATCRETPYLHAALQSLVNQTFASWELIAIVDGAPASDKLTHQIKNWVPDARVFSDIRRGLPSARNAGFNYASGKLIVFMDDDDIWLAEKLERQVAFLSSRPEFVACHHRCSTIDSEGRTCTESIGKAFDRRSLLRFNASWAFPAFMFRREVIGLCGGFNPHYPLSEDLGFLLALVDRGEIGFLEEELMQYRRHSASQTGDVTKTITANLRVLRDRAWEASWIDDTETAQLLEYGIGAQRDWGMDVCYAAAVKAIEVGDLREAAVMFTKAARFDLPRFGGRVVREAMTIARRGGRRSSVGDGKQ